MLKQLVFPVIACLFFLASCDSFIDKDLLAAMKAYEKDVYVLLKDIDVEGKKLKKGEEIRIIVTPGKEWVKVHAYLADASELKAERFLILYLFDDDFDKKKFNIIFFDQQLNTVVAVRNETTAIKKKKKK